eukprot:4653378-Pyramimonas_sp.AAC.1
MHISAGRGDRGERAYALTAHSLRYVQPLLEVVLPAEARAAENVAQILPAPLLPRLPIHRCSWAGRGLVWQAPTFRTWLTWLIFAFNSRDRQTSHSRPCASFWRSASIRKSRVTSCARSSDATGAVGALAANAGCSPRSSVARAARLW